MSIKVPGPMPHGPVIHTSALSKHFGRTRALDELTLDVPAGVVFGYLGPNGAGKTTTIRLLMGLLRATSGHAEVLGLNAWTERSALHAKVGYLPGDFVAYERLTVEDYLRYLARLRHGAGPGVHWPYVQGLAGRFELDLSRRWGSLSSGNRQKAGIVQAFMHRPSLLVLDEPTKGLDPLMQREFLELVREAREEGQTVFLSSHDLSEVEQVADMVGIVRGGALAVVETVAAMKGRALRRLTLTFAGAPPAEEIARIPGVRDVRVTGPRLHLSVTGSLAEVLRVAAANRLDDVVTHEADLEALFLAYYADAAADAYAAVPAPTATRADRHGPVRS